jgi:hypothetical protein
MWYAALYSAFGIWVLLDSTYRRMNPLIWTLGTVILGPVVTPFYFAKRTLTAAETREGGTAWNVLKWFIVFWTVLMAVVAAAGLIQADIIAAHGEGQKWKASVGLMFYWGLTGAAWFFPFLGALVLGLLLRKSSVVEKGPTGALGAPGAVPGKAGLFTWAGVVALGLLGFWSLGYVVSGWPW